MSSVVMMFVAGMVLITSGCHGQVAAAPAFGSAGCRRTRGRRGGPAGGRLD